MFLQTFALTFTEGAILKARMQYLKSMALLSTSGINLMITYCINAY